MQLRRVVPALLVVLLLLAFWAGQLAREQTGLEVSTESIQRWVALLGWRAPAVYVALIAFRQFLLLPSMVILSAGGLLFGVTVGTLLGGLGILLSASLNIAVGRGIGLDWLGESARRRLHRYERWIRRAGPLVVGVGTAHPLSSLTAFHYGAGFARLPLVGLGVAVALGGQVRAFGYAFLGSTLMAPGSSEFYVATTLLLGMILLPLAHPGVRRRVFKRGPRGGGH